MPLIFYKNLLNTEKVEWREVCILARFCQLVLRLNIKDSVAIGKSLSFRNVSIEKIFFWWHFVRESKSDWEWLSKLNEVVDFGFAQKMSSMYLFQRNGLCGLQLVSSCFSIWAMSMTAKLKAIAIFALIGLRVLVDSVCRWLWIS